MPETPKTVNLLAAAARRACGCFRSRFPVLARLREWEGEWGASGREPGGGLTLLRYGTSGMGCILWDSSAFSVGPSGRRTRFVLDLLLTKQVDIDAVPL